MYAWYSVGYHTISPAVTTRFIRFSIFVKEQNVFIMALYELPKTESVKKLYYFKYWASCRQSRGLGNLLEHLYCCVGRELQSNRRLAMSIFCSTGLKSSIVIGLILFVRLSFFFAVFWFSVILNYQCSIQSDTFNSKWGRIKRKLIIDFHYQCIILFKRYV